MKLFIRAGAAAALAAATGFPAAAQDNSVQLAGAYELPAIIATASRLPAGVASSSVSVVTREEIEKHPGKTLPEILSGVAGVNVRDFYGNGASSESSVDLRGFGEQAAQNTLVLVDGRRINDFDLSGVQFALVPRNAIERIEIVRGAAASVLYGDGAVGGAINIVTRDGQGGGTPGVSVAATAGSFGLRRVRGGMSYGGEQILISLSSDITESEGYRRNNELMRQIRRAGLRVKQDWGLFRAEAAYNTQSLGLPGARFVEPDMGTNELATDRKGTNNPDDVAEERGVHLSAGAEVKLGDGLDLIVDAGFNRSLVSSDFYSQFTLDDRTLATSSLTPRLRFTGEVGGMAASVIVGVDAYYTQAEVDQRFIGFAGGNDYDGWQSSLSFYGQGDLALSDRLTLDAGARLIRTEVKLESPQNTSANVREDEVEYAANLGLSYALSEMLTVHARGGRAVRVPTLDERVGTQVSGITFLPLTFDLDTQTSWDVEAGVVADLGFAEARLTAFQMWVKDQIAFDPVDLTSFGYNTNLDDTRRRGIEAEARIEPGAGFAVTPHVTWTEAEFTEGAFKGNDIPAVPEFMGGVGLSWTSEDGYWAALDWQHVSEQRMLNDQGATFPEIPAYSVLDISAGGVLGPVGLKAELRNALDEDYYNVAIASDTNSDRYAAYPLPGRAFYVEASLAF